MDVERYNRVVGIFQQAVEMFEPNRTAYVTEACGDDAELRRNVESMLASDALDHGALSDAQLGVGRELLARSVSRAAGHPSESGEVLPERLGRYEIVRIIGRGGMGCVYEAIQDQPHRTVALKVIRPELLGFGSAELLRRFELEAEALGRLAHPGIAQVFEAGTAPVHGGMLPFVAMELVRGNAITHHAADKRLSTKDRLRLFVIVCDAVQHAHEQGVIHRDLKPGNIFVNDRGEPKILDFGVARLTDSDLRTTTLHTNTGQMIGTVAYMSPEQVTGDPRAIDARCDVYALGVVLYELLAGRLPHDLKAQPIVEAARIIREDDPSRLSRIDRQFRGDVETIVARAMEKEPARRYAAAAEMAADIRRFLNDEPIIARPARTLYQLRKFARRNRALVGGVAASFVLLIGGMVSTFMMYRSAEAQRRVAAETVRFLNEDMLGSVDPANARGRELTIRQTLDNASQRIEGRFRNDPLVEASIRPTLGKVYSDLAVHEPARRHIERAAALRTKFLGPSNLDTLAAQRDLARELGRSGNSAEAESLHRQSLRLAEQTHGDHSPIALRELNDLADLLRETGRPTEALPLLERLVRLQEELLGPEHEETLTCCNNLAVVYENQGRYDDAEKLQRRVCETRLRRLGEDHPNTISSMNNLGYLLLSLNKYDEAEKWLKRAVGLSEQVLGLRHDSTLLYTLNLSLLYNKLQRWQDASDVQKKLWDSIGEYAGLNHSQFIVIAGNYGWTLTMLDRFDEAQSLLKSAYDRAKELYTADNWKTAFWEARYGECLRKNGRVNEADPLLTNALRTLRKNFGPDDGRVKTVSDFRASLNPTQNPGPTSQP